MVRSPRLFSCPDRVVPVGHLYRQLADYRDSERYTAVERSQHLTQGDLRVFGQSYVANCSSVDGMAAFLDEPTDHSAVNYFQSLEKFHEPGLPCKLPAKVETTLKSDPGLLELKSEVQALKHKEGAGSALDEAKRRRDNYRVTLWRNALTQYQEKWVQDRRKRIILTRGKDQPSRPDKTDIVQSIYLIIPERARLARITASDETLSVDAMWNAMQDLYSLCTRDSSVLYLPGLEPFEGACPVKCCQQKLDR